MKTLKFVAVVYIVLVVLSSRVEVYAYNDTITHPGITEQAVQYSTIETYLMQNLGSQFSQGIDSKINGIRMLDWLTKGSTDEDDPMCRASNHFHNPLLPWDQSFMSDDDTTIKGYLVRFYCNWTGWPHSDRKSSVTWATRYLSPAPGGSKITIDNQQWGWDDARNYYYLALTGLSDTDRETNFANTFQALGQVVHLIQDGSVPAHVRNDFTSHTKFTHFELSFPLKWFGNKYEYYVKRNSSLVATVTPTFPDFTNPGVTDFWDTDQYIGNNPSTSLTLGITEYTNANYFSNETIPNNNPTPEHTFTYPQVDSTNAQLCEDNVPSSTNPRKYVSRQGQGDCIRGSNVDHFAAVSLVNMQSDITNNNIPNLKLELDENVYNTYASDLLPLAVGYSADLLDYFFRGEVGIVAIEEVITGQDITGLNLTIKNLTLNEDMSNGNVEVAYRYKPQGSTVFTYGLSDMLVSGSIAYQSEAAYTFTFPTPIPVSATEVQYTYVFKGTLGQEVGAVVGKVATIDNTGFIFTSGGDSLGQAFPGMGGSVTMEAGAVVPPVAATDSLIVPYGSTVNLSGLQEFVTIQIDGTVDATGTLTLRASNSFSLNRNGLINVENGIDGGTLTIESEGTIAINGLINTSGKNAASGNGGNGGDVTIRTSYTGYLQVPTIITRGGDTDESDCPNSQVSPPIICTSYIAGNGGDIVITSTGDIIFNGAATDDPAYIPDTLPPPPPYTLGTPDKPRPDPGERLPLLRTDFRRGLLTTGGIGGSGLGSGTTAGGGGTGGDGGRIYISTTGGNIIFRDIDLFTGGDIEKIEADIYLPVVWGQYPFFAYTGSIGGKGTGGGGSRGGDGGFGGKGGDIEIAQGQLNPSPVSFTRAVILGHNGENPNYYDNVSIGETLTAFDISGRQLYRLKVFDDNGIEKTLGGSGGFPGGSVYAFPGWFGLRGTGGTIINLPTM